MTPREQAEQAGFESVAELARMIGKPYRTVYDWAAFNKTLFRAVILGCEQIRKEQRYNSKTGGVV